MNNKFILFPFVLIAFHHVSFSQQKYEREYKIKKENVPSAALAFMGNTIEDHKINWYLEEQLEGKSIEAKFKLEKKRYSVEFDTRGVLQDIEIEVNNNGIPETVYNTIIKYLTDTSEKFRINKIQIQYSGLVPSLESFIQSNPLSSGYTIKYELVVQIRREGQWQLYEISFDASGQVQATSRIILRNTDNLEF